MRDVSTTRKCKIPELEHVRKFVAHVKAVVNETRYYPPISRHRYLVALALYSKCITVAEATILLIDHKFCEEAFGMTRTLIDIFITLRYIANKDIDERAKRYAHFIAKDSQVLGEEVIPEFWPASVEPLDVRTKQIAGTYRSPHYWSGKTVKDMALEPDTFETDPATGQPYVHTFSYKVTYRWTSHFVHPSIVALENHLVQAGRDNFVVRRGLGEDKCAMAVFNIAWYVSMTMVAFYRCMGDPQPHRVGWWSEALVKHIARRHNIP